MLTASSLLRQAKEPEAGKGLLTALTKLNAKPLLDKLKRWNHFHIINREQVADAETGETRIYKRPYFNTTVEGQIISRIINTKWVEILQAIAKLPQDPPENAFECAVNSVVNSYLTKLETDGYIERTTNVLKGDTYVDRRPEKEPAIYLENLNLSTRKDLQEAIGKLYKKEQAAELYDIFNIGRTKEEDPENPGSAIYSESLNPEKLLPDFLSFLIDKSDKGNLGWLMDMANAQMVRMKGEKSVNNPSGMIEYKNSFYNAPIFKFFRAVGATPEAWERPEEGVAGDVRGKSLFPLVVRTVENMYSNVMGTEGKFGDIIDKNNPETMEFLDKVNLRGTAGEFFSAMRTAQVSLRKEAPQEGQLGAMNESGLGGDELKDLKNKMDSVRVETKPEATPETMTIPDSELILKIRKVFLRDAVVPALKSTLDKILKPEYLGDKIFNSFRTQLMDRSTYLRQVFPHIQSAVKAAVSTLDQSIDKLDIRTSLVRPLIDIFEDPIARIPASVAGANLKGPLLAPEDAESIAKSLAQELIFQAGQPIQTAMDNQTRGLNNMIKKENPELPPQQSRTMINNVKQEFNALLKNSR